MDNLILDRVPPPNGVNAVNGLEEALVAIEESPRLGAILALCLQGRYDEAGRNFARGDSAYHGGDAGILAGALAAHYKEHLNPGWRAWLPAARVVLELAREVREGRAA